jgi:hypothetical protein
LSWQRPGGVLGHQTSAASVPEERTGAERQASDVHVHAPRSDDAFLIDGKGCIAASLEQREQVRVALDTLRKEEDSRLRKTDADFCEATTRRKVRLRRGTTTRSLNARRISPLSSRA